MSCFKPLEAWRSSEKTPNGKNRIVFNKSAKVTSLTSLKLPCGMCIGCRLDRSLVWAIRCVHEAQLHDQNSFITLTYSPEAMPRDGSLIKFHFQDFMKRLRKHPLFNSQTVRYFMCGEYGEKFSRPHYHACLFGIDFPDKQPFKDNEGIITWSSELLDSIWTHGYTTIGEVNFDTAAYTARYITKKVLGQEKEDHYYRTCEHTMNLVPIEPEYATMSLKPAIGKEWYEKYKSDIYPSDFLVHQGKKLKIPRYYDNLYEIAGGDIEEIKTVRKQNMRKHLKDNTPERLAVREEVTKLRYKQSSRSYENDTQNIHNLR
ncbi:replication initiator protein [Microviridae sp.]|nr:replication initiator protein [Microviridae sp.]